MAIPSQPSVYVAFGPFKVDKASCELFKSGVRVRLNGQPFRILLLLLEHPGEVVTREQLREQIWGSETFVDFEHSLNVAINKLRRALRDSPGKPRYIETEPGRGYRFIASIQAPDSDAGPAPSSLVEKSEAAVPAEEPQAIRPERRPRWILVGASLGIVAIVGCAFLLRPAPALTAKDTIVVADFRNATGDPVFDGTLRQGLTIELEQSPFITLISEERMRKVLSLMGRPVDSRLTPELASEICERTGSAAVLEGSIARLGTQYVLGLSAKNCRTGDTLDNQQAQAARKEDVLGALTEMAAKFRKRAGESLATISRHSTPLSEATTPSLEALKAFSNGSSVLIAHGHVAASPWFKRATEIDPEFATAYAWLGRTYSAAGEHAAAAECSRRAWQLRNRASDPERFYIDFSYHRFVTGNLEKAMRVCELWAQAYPRDPFPHGFLASSAATALGKFEKAEDESNKSIALSPDRAMAYANLANAYRFQNRFTEAERAIERAMDRKLALPDFQISRFYSAFLKNDATEMERIAALSQDDPELQDLICDQQGLVLAYHGRLRQARTMSRRAVDLARQSENPESAAQHEAGAAVREALFGSRAQAHEYALAALKTSNGRDAVYGAAIALALSNGDSMAEALADDLEKRYPEDTLVRFNYLPTLRAILAASHRDFSKGIELLETAAPYELGWQGCCSVGFVPSLYPIYVRGLVYQAAHRDREAAAEFQKVLDHRGIVVTDPIGALSRLQLARAHASSGNRERAKAGYEDFLALWREADSDIPILQEAKAEYAKLL